MKSIFYKSILPLIVIGITGMQFHNVQTNHLSTWKGGGFGMYADIHWNFREVWFFGLPKNINPMEGFYYEASCVRQYPSRENMLMLGGKVRDKYKVKAFSMEVWEPRYGQNGTITRVLLNRADVK